MEPVDPMAGARLVAVLAGCVSGLILGAVAAGIVLIAGYYRDQAVSRYGPGRPVTVYYDPRNPADAVLERRDAARTLWIVAAIVFVLAALFPVLFVLAGLAAMNG